MNSCCCSLPPECCQRCSNRITYADWPEPMWTEPMWRNSFYSGRLTQEDISLLFKKIEKSIEKCKKEVKQCES